MHELKLNLTEYATRQYILESLQDILDLDDTEAIDAALDRSNIDSGHYHDLAAVNECIENAQVSDGVKEDAQAVYSILAQAEAQVHGCKIEDTHFHEVGNADAVRNVLAICLAIETLAPLNIVATKVQTGEGRVNCAHGELDIPAPATAAILDEYDIPLCEETLPGERCTPTSAALIAHFVEYFE